ncbi:MAG: rhodanese-like domain-containing protein, partial [Candidatus Hydrogenedentota bacterium]
MGTFNQVEIEDAKKAIEAGTCTIVDIRDPGSYEEAHIDGAVHLNDATVEESLRHTDRQKPVLV